MGMIRAEKLVFEYDKRDEEGNVIGSHRAIDGVDIDVPQGSFVAILGHNGSGKSTLLNILGILDNYDSGEYRLNDVIIKDLSETRAAEYRNKMIGFIFQSFNLILFKTAVENVELPLFYQGVGRRKRHELAMQYLDKLGLAQWANHYPNEMSGGQKQRVAIAAAVASEKELLVFDELTSGLDYFHMMEAAKNIRDLSARGKTVFLITHDPELIAACCNFFLFFERGKIQWSGGATAEKREKLRDFFAAEEQ